MKASTPENLCFTVNQKDQDLGMVSSTKIREAQAKNKQE
jgi:hypothetical protein